MKYMKQFGIIAMVSFLGEILNKALPFPVPASVYGLVAMVIFLLTGIIKLEMIEETADFLISIMVLFFIPSSVGLMTSFDALQGNVLKIFIACLVSTIVAISVTGLVAQIVIKFTHKGGDK